MAIRWSAEVTTATAHLDYTDLQSRDSDGSHITKPQIEHIETYVRDLLQRLDLNYWRVYVAKDMPPERARLMIEPTDGRRVAMLYVSEGWYGETPAEEKRTDLVHEVLHLAHHDQEEVIRRFKNDNGDVGAYAMQLIWLQFKTETERMVDSLSYVIAPFIPEWVDATEETPATDEKRSGVKRKATA